MHVQPILGVRGATRVLMGEATVAYGKARTAEVYDSARTTHESKRASGGGVAAGPGAAVDIGT